MKGKTAVSVLLIVCAVLAVAYAYFIDRGKVSDTEKKQRTAQVFPIWRKADITRIDLEVAGQQNLVLERDADAGELEYRMTAPVTTEVDTATLDRLLSVLDQTNYVRKLDAEPADFGAIRVHGRVRMGSMQITFDLAGPAPTPEGAAYFRLDGKSLLVVPKDFVLDLQRPVDAYRDKTVVPYLSVGLRGLTLRSRSRQLELTRQDDLSFLISGDNVRASRKTIDRVWTAFAEMRAEKFLSVATARKLTDDPVAVIRMTPFSGETAELRLGGPCPDAPEDIVFLRLSAPEVGACVPKGVLQGLSLEAKELVDDGPFVTRTDEVTELVATDLPTGFVLDVARKGGGFRLRTPQERDLTPGENALFQSYMDRLFALSGMDVVKGEALKVPILKFLIHRARGAGLLNAKEREEATETIEIGRDAREGKLYLRRSSDGARYVLDESALSFLRPHAGTLRDETLWGAAPGGAQPEPREIELDCGAGQKLTKSSDGAWMSHAFPVDQAAAVNLADALRRAKPSTWLHPDSFASASIASHKCTVHVIWEGDAGASSTVDFGDKIGSYVFGGRRGDKTPTLLPADLLALAKVWYVERAFLRDAVPADIASLVVTKGTRSVTLASEAELGEGPARGDAGGAEAEGPRSQIGTLRANAALHLGAIAAGEFDREKVEVKVTLKRDSGVTTRLLTFAPKADKSGYLLRYDGVPATFELTNSASLSALSDLVK